MGCRVFNRGIQKQKSFWPEINTIKGNYLILLIDIVTIMASCQKVSKFDSQKSMDFLSKNLNIGAHFFKKVLFDNINF